MRPTGQLLYILAMLSPRRSAACSVLSAEEVYRREFRALCPHMFMASSSSDKPPPVRARFLAKFAKRFSTRRAGSRRLEKFLTCPLALGRPQPSTETGAAQEPLKSFVYHRTRGLESCGVIAVFTGLGGVDFMWDWRPRHCDRRRAGLVTADFGAGWDFILGKFHRDSLSSRVSRRRHSKSQRLYREW
jgi:hypothetical protein